MKPTFYMPALLAGTLPLLPTIAADETTDFDWGAIQPSTSLHFTPCYDNFKCARLSVPMDWQSSDSDNCTDENTRVDIAVLLLPATVPEDDPTFAGTVVFNPGGPGAAGVDSLRSSGAQLREIASSPEAHFAVLSFDPRGIGLTKPSARCFATDPQPPANIGSPTLDTNEDLAFTLSWNRAVNGACASSANNTRIFEFMSTVDVARDMVAIVDQLPDSRLAPVPASDGRQDPTPRIVYWGFSYGTDLGNTFASLFPGRVKRMLLEGVDSVPHTVTDVYPPGDGQDLQGCLERFWRYCFDGKEGCALYRDGDTGPAAIEDRVRKFLHTLDQSPIITGTIDSPVVARREDYMDEIKSSASNAMAEWGNTAMEINKAMTGNYTSFGDAQERIAKSTDINTSNWTLSGVACGEAAPAMTNMTFKEAQDYVESWKKVSPDFAYASAGVATRLDCAGWPFRARHIFRGPWATPEADPNLVPGRPAAPILFVTSMYDPLTPRAYAFEMARAHPGARVLMQDTVGHGAINTPSRCREAYIKKYFAEGALPAEDVMCESDCVPFQDCPQLSQGSYAVKRAWPAPLRRRRLLK